MKKLIFTFLMATGIVNMGSLHAQQTQDKPLRRVLMEEYTGTWCNNCPRGIASVQHLQKEYGDRFIAIAIHQDSYDPMKTNLYAAGNGYPNCNLNRSVNCDPFFGTSWNYSDPIGVKHDIDKLLKQDCFTDVEVTASWNDPQRNSIQLTATATFASADDNANYRWAFVVTEDGMHGEQGDRNWLQQNKYVGDTDWLVMPEMEPFVYGTALMEMEYDHVAVDGYGIRQGIEGSIPTTVEAKEPVTFTHTIDITDNKLIQNKDNLHIVAILLNKKYNDVENAATCDISPSGSTTGVEHGYLNPSTRDEIPPRKGIYDLQGRRIANNTETLHKGVYIIKGKKTIVN